MGIEVYLIMGVVTVIGFLYFRMNRIKRELEEERAKHRLTVLKYDQESRKKALDIKRAIVENDTKEAILNAQIFIDKYRDYIGPNTLSEIESLIRKHREKGNSK